MSSTARPLIVGFAGTIGCGKSLRSKYLASLFDTPAADARDPWLHVAGRDDDAKKVRALLPEGAQLFRIDCDKVGHEAYTPGSETYNHVVQHFGRKILGPYDTAHGNPHPPIDRKALGKIVFSDPAELQALNSIVWPAIARDVDAKLDAIRASHGGKACVFVEGALLVEISAVATECDALWFYHADKETAIARVQSRDNLPREDIERRLAAQHPIDVRLLEAAKLPGHEKRPVAVFDTSEDSVEAGCHKAAEALVSLLELRAGTK
eukprot:CAMPEP_0174851612 /NCGR_PEP_ID=MMETSP1114-20130205/23283_1 /TAXON_ID=312471 /ORGANISM="Neobodo designis, Strain CCAP 1951/1" /LENGTH=264 /DNA_ID=CAMNT_0016086159 /DNA_START=76 /DNA_END=870 /DNA_ORIENTATION=+